MNLDGPTLLPEQPCYRGNLHSHTTETDGRATPQEVMEQYRRLGYDFLALSDHDLLVQPRPEEIPEGLTLIPAYEAGVGPHILCIGVPEAFPKTSDRQTVIDQVNAAGGLAILNHPNWGRNFSHWDQEMLESLRGYIGIEIYNAVIEILEGSPYALDRWDRLLTAGHRTWGFAHDDSHAPYGVGHGWLMVQASANTPEALLFALCEGRFYSTTGVTVTDLTFDDETLVVRSEDADRIRLVSRWGRLIGLADKEAGTFLYATNSGFDSEPLLEVENGLAVRYRFRGDEGYVRCEALGRGGRTAWTQPVWISEG